MIRISRRELARYAADQLVAGVSAKNLSQQLAAVLVSSHRMGEAELLADDIAWELEARGQLANAKVTSAHRLAPKLREQLLAAIKQAAKVATVEMQEVTDASVLGGLRIETAAHSWDETIARRLNDLRGVA
jgi:F0F1-type ATP synthase delta subunit